MILSQRLYISPIFLLLVGGRTKAVIEMAKVQKKSTSIQNQSTNPLIDDLMDIGFTQNEAKTYFALVSLESAAASNLVRITGIRDSKIYQILDRIEKKGFITVQNGTPKKYMAVHPTAPLENMRLIFEKEFQNKKRLINRLTTILPPMYHENEDTPKLAYIIKGKKNILNHIKRLTEETEISAVLMMPNEEIIQLLEKPIKRLQDMGIDSKLGIYYKVASSVNPLLKIQSIACECFFLIIDNRVLLTVSGWKTDKWHAIWTTETSLIEVSSGYFASPCCAYESESKLSCNPQKKTNKKT